MIRLKRRQTLSLCVLAGLYAAVAIAEPAPSNANTVIKPYRASYEASYKGIPLQAVHTLERSGNHWILQTSASGFFGQIDENSTFTITADGKIQPLHYLYQRSVMGHNRKHEVLHNQQEKLAVGKKDGKKFSHPLTGNEQDQGSYLLALRTDLAAGKTEMCYPVVEDKRMDQYCFKVNQRQQLATSIGQLDTVIVSRIRKADSPRQTRFWFAVDHDYIMVKLDHRENPNESAYSLKINDLKPQ